MKLSKNSSAFLLAAVSAAWTITSGVGASVAQAQSTPVFDWSVNDNSTPGYTPSPFLTDSSAQSVHDFLLARYNADHNAVLAVKVNQPISNATAALVFGSLTKSVPYSVKYVFADFESQSVNTEVNETKALVGQVQGAGSNSKGAFIGEFSLSNIKTADGTRSTQGGIPTAASFQAALLGSSYTQAKVNMSNPDAYPGSPDYETAAQAGSPDIRSALFVLPIDRITFASLYADNINYDSKWNVGQNTNLAPGTYTNIPWVNRFENWGNKNLDNVPGFTSGGVTYQYAFQTSNQLLSRGDFSAQVLQYRLRGATSFNLFNYNNPNASIIGYSASSEQFDALKGWNADTSMDGSANPTLTGILSRSYGFANMTNKVPGSAPNTTISSANSGMMLSGVYDKSFVNGQKNMVLLLSNMSESTKKLDFTQRIGGASIDFVPSTKQLEQLETIAPGTHELLTFTLNTTVNAWVLTNGSTGSGSNTSYGQVVFADSNRAGVGVPEPTSLGLLSLAGIGLLARRRRSL